MKDVTKIRQRNNTRYDTIRMNERTEVKIVSGIVSLKKTNITPAVDVASSLVFVCVSATAEIVLQDAVPLNF